MTKLSDYLNEIAEQLERLAHESRGREVKTLLPELHSEEAHQALAEVVLALLEQWHVHELNQAVLLGVADVNGLRNGEPLPDEYAVLERVGHLLAINRLLSKRFLGQPGRIERWLALPQSQLGDKAPLELMLVGGLEGVRQVRALLEAAREAS